MTIQKGSSAVGNHVSNMNQHGERVAVGVTEVSVPHYGEITLDDEGRAYLPHDFLPALVDKLPNEWYYATYPWFKYFDQTQRDASGELVLASRELTNPVPENVDKWKLFVKRMFITRFKEEGRLCYGVEMGSMAALDKVKYSDTTTEGRHADTVDLTMKLLFNEIAPPLLAEGNLGKLISYVWKWVYVPNLEGNNQWVKDGVRDFFKIDGARVVLSDHTMAGKRVHSVVKMFKKYGTQSAIRTLKNLEIKRWGLTIEVSRYVRKDRTMPPCAESERWSIHNIAGYLDDRTRNMMRRNGACEFLVKHYRKSDFSEGQMFMSDLNNTVQRALNCGCDEKEVSKQLREMVQRVEGGKIKRVEEICDQNNNRDTGSITSLREGGGLREDSNFVDSRYEEDIHNLRSAEIEDMVDQLGLENELPP